MLPLADADFDVVVTARIDIDNYYLREMPYDVGADVRSRLRRQIQAKLPDGYSIHDFEGEYRTWKNRERQTTTFELRVYL